MTLRYTLSQLSRPEARRSFGRWWLGICLAGALGTVLLVGDHLFVIAALWLLGAFAPVRIAVEALHTVGPGLRRQLQAELAQREDRYATREQIVLRVETLFGRDVRLPRIAPPDLGTKVVEAAVRLIDRARSGHEGPLGVLRTTTVCGVLLERWVGTIAAGEEGAVPRSPSPLTPAAQPGDGAGPPALWDPRASIQDQWATLRAVAALAALTKTLVAVYEDHAGALQGGAALRLAADNAMDYADQVGLHLDGPAWEDVSAIPRASLSPDRLARLAETWMTFCAAPLPAPRRLQAFVETLTE